MSKLSLVLKSRPRKMESWQDCQWRRKACGRDDCPICSRMMKDAEMLVAAGKDPDDMESMLALVSRNFKEMIELLRKEAENLNIDIDADGQDGEPELPQPTDFPLYNKISQWRQGIHGIVENSDITSEAWLYSEAGEDLLWYSSTLAVKIYRQLCSAYEIEKDHGKCTDTEYKYTGYVLGQVMGILDKALLELSINGGAQAEKFHIARLSFDAIKLEILSGK